jgi:hypothetical protein
VYHAVKAYKPKFGGWWLFGMVLGILFFFAVVYGGSF